MTPEQREESRREMVRTALAHPQAAQILERLARQDARDVRRAVRTLRRKAERHAARKGPALTAYEAFQLDALERYAAASTPAAPPPADAKT